MARPTRITINKAALLHNVQRVKQWAPNKKIVAMVKANAYGCGLASVLPALDAHVDAFGVACMEEAVALRALGSQRDCVLFQGVFTSDEWPRVADLQLQCVIHQACQLEWLLACPLAQTVKIWVKVDTGMHRLGFEASEVPGVMDALNACPWVQDEIGLMSHLACADEPNHPSNGLQLEVFNQIRHPNEQRICSMANSAAIMALPEAHADVVRPGIMLYGVSPFPNQTAQALGLIPVMRFESAVSVIHHYPANARIGYGGSWMRDTPSVIGVVAVGYGDGYPRHIAPNTPVWVNGVLVPVVGRVSMDMLTIDLTDNLAVRVGDAVELWGQHVPVERIAQSAGTIPYELLCHVSSRVR